jgi:hypothetical protein
VGQTLGNRWRSSRASAGDTGGVHLAAGDGRAYVIAPASSIPMRRCGHVAALTVRVRARRADLRHRRVVWVRARLADPWRLMVRTTTAVRSGRAGDRDPVSAVGARTAGDAFVMDSLDTL